jgi:hypothetical protein
MRKVLTRAAVCLLCGLLGGVVGCGGGEQEDVISRTLSALSETTTKLGEVKRAVRQAATTHDEKKDQKITETDPNLVRALESAKEVRKLGERVQILKERAERLKSKTSEDYSKELAGRYRARLEDGVKAMQQEEEELDVALTDAEARASQGGKEMLGKIRQELKAGRESFEVLTKQQR